MRQRNTTLAAVILAPALAGLNAPAVTATAGGPHCGARVAVLGADMSAGGRFEVQRALGVGAHTVQLVETRIDEEAQAAGLIPPALLKEVAVSSGLLHPLPAGSGLRVTVNAAITLDTAQTYANTLLTAGVTDAEVRVAAPSSQRALGTTALLGLLRAARQTCLAIDPARERLALREAVIASGLEGAPGVGRLATAPLLFALKGAAAVSQIRTSPALANLIARTAAAHRVAVPRALQPSLVTYLHDLVAAGAYRAIAARAPSLAGTLPSTVLVHLAAAARPVPAAPAPVPSPAPSPTPLPHPARSFAGVWRGRVIAVSHVGVTVRERGGTRTYRAASELHVERNGQRSALGALQPADAVTVTTNAAGTALHIAATARGAPPAAFAPRIVNSVLSPVLTVAALLVFLLLALPLVAATRRRRDAGDGATRRATPHTSPASQSRTVVFEPHAPAGIVEGVQPDES